MYTILENGTIITPSEVIDNGVMVINETGRIDFVGKQDSIKIPTGLLIDVGGKIISPGFLDVHTHGGNGVDFSTGKLSENLDQYSKWAATSGVTGFLCSIAAPDKESLNAIISQYADIMESGVRGAQALGMHLEGPFLNPKRKGAFNPAWLRSPDLNEVEDYLRLGKGWIKQMTLSPELSGALQVAALLKQKGVVASLGHSDAVYELASAALKKDFSHVTHCFNAQSGFNHRAPGVVGAVLDSEKITAELIGDGIHVHPAAMQILLRCVGEDRIVLITDAMPGAGLPDGQYEMIGQTVQVKNGKAVLSDGTLAGSTAQLNQCVRNMNQLGRAALTHSINMASINPARVLGLSNEIGSLQKGLWANLIVIDKDINVFLTMVKGKIVHDILQR